jgi:hypothetical protein
MKVCTLKVFVPLGMQLTMQTPLHSIPNKKCVLQGSLSIVPHAFDQGGTIISSATKNLCSDLTNWSLSGNLTIVPPL